MNMILTDYRFLLDVHETNSQISLSFKQGDTGRVLYITLTENGDIFNIPQDCVAVFTALKPDGTIIFNDCEINGNEIVYTNTAQTAAVTGKVDCELRLYGTGNTLITSPHFTVFVHPTVYFDQIESKDEVNTLTNLISEVGAKLKNGDFIPKLGIGEVKTLPAGSMATVEMTGTAEAPILNFAIPQGEEGQAETIITDTELSLDSTRPVQNRVIAQAFINQSVETTKELKTKADAEETAKALETKADAEETAKALESKVPKEDGKQLSSNDYTNEEKGKLSRIDEGANNYTLPAGGEELGGVKNGGDIEIDAEGKMNVAAGALSASVIDATSKTQYFPVTIPLRWPVYKNTVQVPGLKEADSPSVALSPSVTDSAVLEAFNAMWFVVGAGALIYYAQTKPSVEVPINITQRLTAETGAEWTGEAAPYSQEIEVEGLLATVVPQLEYSSDAITKVEVSENKMIVYAYEPLEEAVAITVTQTRSVAVASAEWGNNEPPFAQTVAVDGLLENDQPKVHFKAPANFAELDDKQEVFSYLYRVVASERAVTFYAKEPPEKEFDVTLEVTRI